jgi:outer membrane protein assembly factor BamB
LGHDARQHSIHGRVTGSCAACTRRAAAIPVLAALAAFAAPASRAASDGDWPRWRGARFDGTVTTGRNIFARPFSLKVRWRRTIGAGYSGVVVAGGLAVTMASDGKTDYVIAISADSGDETWRAPVGDAYPGRDGSTGGPVSTPSIADGVVYALGPRGTLVAVQLASGKALWRRKIDAEVPHWGLRRHRSSPATSSSS